MSDRFQPRGGGGGGVAGITELQGDVTAVGPGVATATVEGLQGNPVDAAAPRAGEVLTWDGAQWTPTAPYPSRLPVPPAAASWTWFNQSTATKTDYTATSVRLYAPAGGGASIIQGMERPVAAGFSITVAFVFEIKAIGDVGVYFRDATDKIFAITRGHSPPGSSGYVASYYYSSPVSGPSNLKGFDGGNMMWGQCLLRITDDGAKYVEEISTDALHWWMIHEVAHGTNGFGAPVAAGLYVDAFSNAQECYVVGCSGL